jgi:hypothetical protein
VTASDHLSPGQFPGKMRTSDLYFRHFDPNIKHDQFEREEAPYLAGMRKSVLTGDLDTPVQMSRSKGYMEDGHHRVTARWQAGEYETPVEWVD